MIKSVSVDIEGDDFMMGFVIIFLFFGLVIVGGAIFMAKAEENHIMAVKRHANNYTGDHVDLKITEEDKQEISRAVQKWVIVALVILGIGLIVYLSACGTCRSYHSFLR